MLPIPLIVNPCEADASGCSFARVSIPLPRGKFHDTPPALLIRNRSNEGVVPHQTEILAHWPDNSIRILHCTLKAPAGDYRIELREPSSESQEAGIRVCHEQDSLVVHNESLVARFDNNSLPRIDLSGRNFFGADGIDIEVRNGAGTAFTASAYGEITTQLESHGPLRTVVTLRGKCSNSTSTYLDFRLRFEFLAGVSGFSLSYCFYNLEPGADFTDVDSIELRLKLSDAIEPQHSICQRHRGLFCVPAVVTVGETMAIAVDDSRSLAHIVDFDSLQDDTTYPFYLETDRHEVENWGSISNSGRRMIVEMDDFHLLRPKELRLAHATAQFGIWPASAGKLSLQQGRSREVTIRVALDDDSAPIDNTIARVRISQLRNVWRAQLPQQAYAPVSFFDQSRVFPFDAQSFPRFEAWLSRMSSSLESVGTFFDLGDTPDSEYRTTYIPLGRQKRMRGDDGGVRWFSTGYSHPALALNSLDDFEPVWVNNEYDIVFALGSEYLRTGDLSLFKKLRWFARHTVEVDFLHYSDHKWLHRAQPAHSARHTTTGAYPSHFWTQGLAQYYMLTGDTDALEVIIALADKTIENLEDPEIGGLSAGLNREVGWGLLSLICAYEASGSIRYSTYARKILGDIMAEGLPSDLPVFSFGHTSMLIAARQYLQVFAGANPSHEIQIQNWLLSWVDLAIACSKNPPVGHGGNKPKSGTYDYTITTNARGVLWSRASRPGIFEFKSLALDSLAYAYEISRDPRYVQAGLRSLEALLDSPEFQSPTGEGKPFATLYRTWINFLAAAAETGNLQEWEYRSY